MNADVLGPIAAAVGVAVVTAVGADAWTSARDAVARIAEARNRVRTAEEDFEQVLRYADSGEGPRDEHLDEGAADDQDAAASSSARVEPLGSRTLALPELWAVTHGRLDLYHAIATGQASRSFRNAQIAMVLGFALLIAFVIVALRASTTAGAIVAGGLGAVAAALAGYVSRTFVRSQETAASHLRAYFDQPLEFSRYLAAERLVADANLTDEQRAEVVTALAQAMIAGPIVPIADTVNANAGVGNVRA
ncbi:hypothetical protein [Streptomyces sp. LARHCF252]